ncbi:MAG: DUF4062 domain-containing protein [Clostridiales bacterium]|nr:DUF4062 domain-containing protein [Clostridiales bacterium]
MIKIFVSSTFADMHIERDAIQMFVLPKIRKIAESVGESFDFCDLRWGINTDEKNENECMVTILETCFREIKKCKPYMIVMLGERYGSCPKIDSNILLSCMNVDDEPQFSYEDIKGKSYTNLEVLYGPLSDDEQFRRTIFLFRRPMSGGPDIYHGTQQDCKGINDLKKAIDKKGKAIGVKNVIEYELEWNDTTDKPSGVEKFVDLLSAKIDEMLSPIFKSFAELSQTGKILRRQWLYIDKKAKYFCGMEELLKKSEDLIDDKKELVILGEEGSGKSCLLSKLAQNKKHIGNVVPYICTRDVTRNEIFSVWAEYLSDILKLSSDDVFPSNDENNAVDRRLEYLLDTYDKTEGLPPLYFFVDGAEKIRGYSFRLAEPIYSKIAFVYSVASNTETSNDNEVFLKSAHTDVGAILTGNMRYYGKDLPGDIIKEIVDKYSGCKPIVINLLFSRLALLNAADFKNGTNIKNQKKIMLDIIAESHTSDIKLCKKLIAVIAERTDSKFIDAVVNYLAASISGLRRSDLQQLLKADGLAWENAYFSVLMDYLNEFFYEHTDGRIEIEHDGLRKSLAAESNVSECRSNILRYLKTLPTNDNFRKEQIYRYCRSSNDRQYLMDILQNDYCKSSQFVRSMGFDVEWLRELIEDGKVLGADARFVGFINNVFCRNVIGGTMNMTAAIIKATSEFRDKYCNGSDGDCAADIARYHLAHLNELFDDNNKTYEQFRYIEMAEGEEFVNTLYDYTIKLKVGHVSEYLNDFFAFLKHNEDKIGKIALMYCYYIYSRYVGDNSQKTLYCEKCLDMIAAESYIDDAFDKIAISIIDDLCGNELWNGKVSAFGAAQFSKYEEQIEKIAKVLANSPILSFYLNSRMGIAEYLIDSGDIVNAEKYCQRVFEEMVGERVFYTNASYDLLKRALISHRVAGLCKRLGNSDNAIRLYDISVKAMTDYFEKYKIPKQFLPEETFIMNNGKGEFIQPRAIISEGYANLADIYYNKSCYEDSIDNLTCALAVADAYLESSSIGSDALKAKVAARDAFLVLDKLINADLLKTDRLKELMEYAGRISHNMYFFVFPDYDFVFEFKGYFDAMLEDCVKSCIRMKEYRTALDITKQYGAPFDTTLLCGIDSKKGADGFDNEDYTKSIATELLDNADFVKTCLKAIEPGNRYVDTAQKLLTTETIRIIADQIERMFGISARQYRKHVFQMLIKKLTKINGKNFAAISLRLPRHLMFDLEYSVNFDEADYVKKNSEWGERGRAFARNEIIVQHLGLAYDYIKKNEFASAECQCDSAMEHLKNRKEKTDKLLEAIIYNIKGLAHEQYGRSDAFEYFDLAVKNVESLKEQYPNMLLADDCLATMLFNKANSSTAPTEYSSENRHNDLLRVVEIAKKLNAQVGSSYYKQIISLANKRKQ